MIASQRGSWGGRRQGQGPNTVADPAPVASVFRGEMMVAITSESHESRSLNTVTQPLDPDVILSR
jgi:hypothetical protein